MLQVVEDNINNIKVVENSISFWQYEGEVKRPFLSFVFLREGWDPKVLFDCNVMICSDSNVSVN